MSAVGGPLNSFVDAAALGVGSRWGLSAKADGELPAKSRMLKDKISILDDATSGAQEVWELLYSSNQHGQSYNSLLMRAARRGPALVVVRDKQGHVFGAFASVPLQKSGQFYGAFISRQHRRCGRVGASAEVRPAAAARHPDQTDCRFRAAHRPLAHGEPPGAVAAP